MKLFVRAARVALHAYPEEFRRERGPEILGTLIDLQDAGSPRRMVELVALMTEGLSMRRDRTVASGRAHVWRSTARWIASWLAPILAAALTLRATAAYLDVYVWCQAPQCTFAYDPTSELAIFGALAIVAVATMLTSPVWRRVSVALSVVLLVELVAWRYRIFAGAGLVLTVALAAGGTPGQRDVARHTLIVVAATLSAVLVPPLALLVAALLPLALLVALAASLVDPRAAIAALALTVALTPLISTALRVWSASGGPHLQPALLPASALIVMTCAALATRSRRSTPA